MMDHAIFNQFPTLTFDSLTLRPFHYDDAPAYLAYLSDPNVNRYVPDECIPKTLNDARSEIDYNINLFRFKRSIYWAIALKDSNEFIGSCGFNHWNRYHSRAEISYDLDRKYWRRSIMETVIRYVVDFAFSHMQLHRIEATVTPENTASLQLLKKIGFVQEGVLREQKLLHRQYHDAIMMALLQKDHASLT